MTVTRQDRVQTYKDGALVADQPIVVDVTVESTVADLASKVRSALATNNTFVGLASPSTAQVTAQVKALTRENTAIIKLLAGIVLGSADLLQDNTGT